MRDKSPPSITVQYNGDRFGLTGPDPAGMSYEDLQSVRQAHSIVGRFIEAQNPDRHDTRTISIHHANIGRFLDRMWNTIPALTHTSERTALKAEEVFNTTELLELIMLQLNTADKLKAMQVKRVWRDTLCESINLCRALGARPHNDGHYYSPFSNRFRGASPKHQLVAKFPGGTYEDYDKLCVVCDRNHGVDYSSPWPSATHMEVRIWVTAYVDPDKFGAYLRDLMIFEPQPREMRALALCLRCHRLDPEGNEYWTMGGHPGNQVTRDEDEYWVVGNLLETAKWVKSRHANCECHWIEFTAVLDLAEDDPIVIERRRHEESAAKARETYIEAKVDGSQTLANAEDAGRQAGEDTTEVGVQEERESTGSALTDSAETLAAQQNLERVASAGDREGIGNIGTVEERVAAGGEQGADDGYDLRPLAVLHRQGF